MMIQELSLLWLMLLLVVITDAFPVIFINITFSFLLITVANKDLMVKHFFGQTGCVRIVNDVGSQLPFLLVLDRRVTVRKLGRDGRIDFSTRQGSFVPTFPAGSGVTWQSRGRRKREVTQRSKWDHKQSLTSYSIGVLLREGHFFHTLFLWNAPTLPPCQGILCSVVCVRDKGLNHTPDHSVQVLFRAPFTPQSDCVSKDVDWDFNVAFVTNLNLFNYNQKQIYNSLSLRKFQGMKRGNAR